MSFSLDTLHCEVKPTIVSSWIGLLIEADLIGVHPDQIYWANVATLEVGTKGCCTYFNDLSILIGNSFMRSGGVLWLGWEGGNKQP